MLSSDTATLVAAFSSDRRSFACVNKNWSATFSSADNWQASLLADFELAEKVAVRKHPANFLEAYPCSTYREAWRSWKALENEYVLQGDGRFKCPDVWIRAARMWSTVNHCLLRMEMKQIVELNPGMKKPKQYIMAAAKKGDVFYDDQRLVETVAAIWGIHDGQSIFSPCPVFGVASFYDQERGLYLQIIHGLIASLTAKPPGGFVFAVQHPHTTESLRYTGGRIIDQFGRETDQPVSFPEEPVHDCLLRFFEHFALDLATNGRTRIIVQRPCMSMFAERGPRTSEAITHGIRVRGTYTPIPARRNQEGILWVYQFEVSYVPGDTNRCWNGKCTLIRRHWTFRDPAKRHPIVVDGEGVVGFFPCFDEHGKHRPDLDSEWTTGPFSYRSCTYASPIDHGKEPSTMEGHFTFAPETDRGEIVLNQAFRVNVGTLTFHYPTFPI